MCPFDRFLFDPTHHQFPSNASRLSRGTNQSLQDVIVQDETALFPFPFPGVRPRPWRKCAVHHCILFFKTRCPCSTMRNEMAQGPFHSSCVLCIPFFTPRHGERSRLERRSETPSRAHRCATPRGERVFSDPARVAQSAVSLLTVDLA